MRRIFERGEFHEYKTRDLEENRGYITESYPGYQRKVTAFISCGDGSTANQSRLKEWLKKPK